jgi:hypothetical protein
MGKNTLLTLVATLPDLRTFILGHFRISISITSNTRSYQSANDLAGARTIIENG